MNKNKNSTNEDEIDLRELFKGFTNRKWWFIGTFIIILIAGLLIIFIRNPGYNSNSKIEIVKDHHISSIEEYFPEEASKLRTKGLAGVSIEMESDEVLEELAGNLSFNISKGKLLNAIHTSINGQRGILTLNVNYTDPESAYEINKKLLDVYKAKKTLELSGAYNILVQKVEKRLVDIQKEINKLSSEAEEYVIDFNLALLEDIKEENPNINFLGIDYIPPDLSIKLDYLSLTYSDLEKIRYSLTEDKELFTNEIEVVEDPEILDIRADKNYKLSALISLFVAMISGIIIVFIVNYFLSFKKKL